MFHKNPNILMKTWTPNIAKLQNKKCTHGDKHLSCLRISLKIFTSLGSLIFTSLHRILMKLSFRMSAKTPRDRGNSRSEYENMQFKRQFGFIN